jgi:uncharacterized membrane protein
MFHKHRLEALSDAVFAIVMTLLVLDLKVPHGIPPGGLGLALSETGREFFSFAMTFAISAVFWTLQHRVFDAIKDTATESLVLTFLALGFVSLLPFTTSLIGQHIADKLAFELYFLNMFAIAACLTVKMEIAHARHRMHEGTDANQLRFRLYRMTTVMLAASVGAHFVSQHNIVFFPLVVGLLFRAMKPVWLRRMA